MNAHKKPIATKRAWKQLRVPPSWIQPGVRVAYHFIMSYHDSEPATVVDRPYQLASGDWCVMIVRDSDGRRIPAAIESLDEIGQKR